MNTRGSEDAVMNPYFKCPESLLEAVARGRRLGLSDKDIAVQLGVSVDAVTSGVAAPAATVAPAPKKAVKVKRVTWNEPTEAELDAMVESRRATMPGRNK